MDRSSAHGFTGSLVTVEGLGQFTGHMIRVSAKNENLLAQQLLLDGTMGQLLACTPDLIAIIDSDTGGSVLFHGLVQIPFSPDRLSYHH